MTDVEWVAAGESDGDVDVILLDGRAHTTAEALMAARAALVGPVLFRVTGELAQQILGALRPEDELSIEGEPDAVLAYRLRKLAGPRDELTGLSTRTAFNRELDRALARATPKNPISVVLLDIDQFKRLNDEHGHGRGDEVLTELGVRLREAATDASCVARTGGEVFSVLLDGDDRAALLLADRLLAVIRASPIAGITITSSAGTATAIDAIGARELLRDADEALYRAKARGRDRALSAEGLRRESAEEGTDAKLESFEDFTRVIAERVADVITWRGRRLFNELRMQADVDALTQLYSRRYLDRRLPFELSEAAREGVVLTVAMMDLDHFGEVNKAHGWPTGDRVLTELSDVIKGHVRSSDWVARYGGEEICVVLTETRLEEAHIVLERVRHAVESHIVTSTRGAEIQVTISIGAAERTKNDDVETLLDRASQALLAAKGDGRNRIHIAQP